jgi:phosphonate transport system substrate-binding protein
MSSGKLARSHQQGMDQKAGYIPHQSTVVYKCGIALLAIALFLAGCISATPQGTPGPVVTATPTPAPSATSTPEPFGNPANPIVLGAVSPESNPGVSSANEQLAALLSRDSGLVVQSKIYTSYDLALTDMAQRKLHVAWMPPLTYLLASQRDIARVALLADHFGVYEYGSQFLTNSVDNYAIFFDPISGLNSSDAPTALAQFSGKRPCWVDPSSVSGYMVPAGILALNHIDTAEPAFTQSHTGIVRSLFVKGVCDFGATFSISGDPRTGSSVLNDLPNALDRIPVIWRTDPIIPNLCIAYLAGLPEDRAKTLTSAFIEVAKTEEGRALLSSSANNYQVDAIKAIEDTRYDPLREVIQVLNINLTKMVGK